jgi:hypothetical protein
MAHGVAGDERGGDDRRAEHGPSTISAVRARRASLGHQFQEDAVAECEHAERAKEDNNDDDDVTTAPSDAEELVHLDLLCLDRARLLAKTTE